MKHRRGATLIELSIVAGLLGLLMTMVYAVLVKGMDFYRDSNDALEIRQEALLGITRLTKELRETSSGVTRITAAQGLVFPSPREASGSSQPTSDGKLTWLRWIAYYLGPQGTGQALFRKEEVIPPPNPVRPPDPDANGKNLVYFSATSPSPAKVVARKVTGLSLNLNADTIEIVLTCSVSTRYVHTVELRTKVVPHR